MEMPREARVSVRLLTEDLLEETNVVVMAAFQAKRSRKGRLLRCMHLQPDGNFVALLGEMVVGVGAVMGYGR